MRKEQPVKCRVGILYRRRNVLRSVSVQWKGSLVELGDFLLNQFHEVASEDTLECIETLLTGVLSCGGKWSSGPVAGEDRSDMDYFYRTLLEEGEYFFVFEPEMGWKCGTTLSSVPMTGRWMHLSDAIPLWEVAEQEDKVRPT